MAGLNILFPAPEEIRVDGKKVTIKPVTLEHFDAYGKAAGSLIEMLGNASVNQINRYASDHASELRAILKAATNLSWRERRALPAAVAVQIMVEVVRANAGFFGEALPAMVESLNGAMLSSD